MVERDSTVTIRVTEDRKERWKEAAEERGLSSLTDFVRLSMENEIGGRDRGMPTDDLDVDLSDDTLERIDDRTGAIEDRLDDLADAVADLAEEGREQSLIAEDLVLDTLPPMSDVTAAEEYGDDPVDVAMTAVDIAEELDADVDAIERTLGQLRLRTERLSTFEEGGVTYYAFDV